MDVGGGETVFMSDTEDATNEENAGDHDDSVIEPEEEKAGSSKADDSGKYWQNLRSVK